MIVKVHKVKYIGKFGPLAKLIMWIQKTDYSHYCMEYESESRNKMILDSTMHGVRESWSEIFFKSYKIIGTYEIKLLTNRRGLLHKVQRHQGKSYGFLQIMGLLLRMCFDISNPFGGNDKRLICNELILVLLRDINGLTIDDSDNYDLNDTEIVLEQIKVDYHGNIS